MTSWTDRMADAGTTDHTTKNAGTTDHPTKNAGTADCTTKNAVAKTESSLPFEQRDTFSPDSTSLECALCSNDFAKLRILDTPGFQSSTALQREGTTAYQANLSIMRQMLRIQARHGLVFNRVCTFYL